MSAPTKDDDQVASSRRGDRDYVGYIAAVIVLIALLVMYNNGTHTLPRTSTAFTVHKVVDLTHYRSLDDQIFESRAAFDASAFRTQSHLHAVTAVKYSLGCYGRAEPVRSLGQDELATWDMLTGLQLDAHTTAPISVCVCVDEHVSVAFGATLFLGVSLKEKVDAVALDGSTETHTRLAEVQAANKRFAGNVPAHLTDDAQFEALTELRDWCHKTAAPVYTMRIASVWNSQLLLLVGVSLIIIGLDLFETRRFPGDAEKAPIWNIAWMLDLLPLAFFVVRMLMFAADTHLHEPDPETSFLMAFVFLVVVVTLVVIVVFSVWANVYRRRQQPYNEIWERIFVDVPMLVGLALLGVALKMQNDEHDELVLLNTMLLLLAGGLMQHLSNLTKEVYDIVCTRFDQALLDALQSGATHVDKTDEGTEQLNRTRYIMQHFGWTRMYGFFTVIVFAIMSWTLSSTTSLRRNPLQFITQNQYVYFVLAYIVALTGLDILYEALPFVTEKDTEYGEAAANRLRKILVCVYLVFLLGSQYSVERSEL